MAARDAQPAPPPLTARDLRTALLWAAGLVLLSWLTVQAGILWGDRNVMRGTGYPKYSDSIQADLFRFDALHYYSVAENGYLYNGNPYSQPNLVFAPMFPSLVRVVAALPGLDTLTAGFALNKVLFWLALALLFLCLRDWIGARRTLFVLGAMATASGCYAFHSWYAESTFLFFLGLGLLAYQRRWWWVCAVAAAALGASRLTGLPTALVFAGLLCLQMREETGRARLRFVGYALLCLAGAAAYLTVLGLKFGNPFVLLDTLQRASWGSFHRETDWVRMLTGGYLVEYWRTAVARGPGTMMQISTINLIWTTLALAALGYLVVAWRRHVLTYVFASYVLMIYFTNIASQLLQGTHRYLTLMFPIFMMFAALHGLLSRRVSPLLAWTVSGCLMVANVAYGILNTAGFNQGVFFWF